MIRRRASSLRGDGLRARRCAESLVMRYYLRGSPLVARHIDACEGLTRSDIRCRGDHSTDVEQVNLARGSGLSKRLNLWRVRAVVVKRELFVVCWRSCLRHGSREGSETRGGCICTNTSNRSLLFLLSSARPQHMPSSPRHPLRLRLRFSLLVVVPLITHQLVEALPKGGDRLVFSCHPKHFFELPVQLVAAGQEFLKALGGGMVRRIRLCGGREDARR